MKNLRGVLLLLAIHFSVVLACAAGSPVIVTHKMTGQSEESNTMEVLVQVRNPGKIAVSNLTLSLVPKPPFMAKRIIQNIATLEAGESIDFPLQLNVPSLAKKEMTPKTLNWAGKYENAQGQTVEFPATSRPGGGR